MKTFSVANSLHSGRYLKKEMLMLLLHRQKGTGALLSNLTCSVVISQMPWPAGRAVASGKAEWRTMIWIQRHMMRTVGKLTTVMLQQQK